mmetsp:Transcript_30893/g.88246  ORF Transcript_30893/g.88246 Transcript_30893/m.88246 type:complete len:417 (+) Transcript_30893:111-1361(+)
MGAAVTAPLGAAATCLGGCCGTFTAGCCYHLAGSGQVGSAQAARTVLVMLQAFTAALAAVAAATPSHWLPWTCDKLGSVSMGDLGICGCAGELACYSDQLVYRAEAAGVLVFLTLLAMAAGGCVEGASRSASVAKFMAVLLIGFVLLFVPNEILSVFGTAATAASAVFLTVQAVMLIDFAYTWNEVWFAKATEARRVAPGSRRAKQWEGGILTSSAVLAALSLVGVVCLFVAVADVGARSVAAVAWLLAAALLVVSITDTCEHGALLTSCVVMAYTTWLVWETLAMLPSGDGPRLPAWAALSVCGISLLSFSKGTGGAASAAVDQESLTPSAGPPPGDAGSTAGTASEGASSPVVSKDFKIQCAVHVAAGIYITAALAPKAGDVTYGLHIAATFLSLLLYGWSLVAPYVFPNRTFG